ncbi:GNAT family N-acetyltransferase [Intestinibacter bartlettii]|uniref:GNAT family N-acetyltransferase n=1 Tax=Intestinibacter bartlettii TaxID=261299 RepID=A0ABS6DZD5_9FIRM|nr:GNAT family protein [Intestinibacter bartlettii]MBU5337207.1 GNAT family N-acetyltransferase [Intestinibacter bartlettii]MDO5009511.1 GNAT family protein [Intestinibacter bartlettii]
MRLRPYKKCDDKYLMKWFNDEEKFQMWSAGEYKYPLDEKQLQKHREKFEENENAWLFSMLNDEGRLVGHVAIKNADYKLDSAYIGFIVVDPEQRGKGYGKGLVNLITKYIFDILNINKVTLYVYAQNTGAIKCYESVGFKQQGIEISQFNYKKEKWDRYLMVKSK